MAVTVNVNSTLICDPVNRAHLAISKEYVDRYFSPNKLLDDIVYRQYVESYDDFWYQKTNSVLSRTQADNMDIVFDTEEDYLLFLIQWSD